MADKITEYVVKHYYGSKDSYSDSNHAYGIYFATDTKEIILNGDIYGYNSAEHKEIANVEWDSASDSLVFTYSDGTTSSVSVPTASEDADGLLSAAGFTKLEGIDEGAQENVIETVQVNGTALEVTDKTVNVVIPDAVEYTGKDAIEVDSDAKIGLVIDPSDKVLTQSDSGLLANLGIDYYSTTSEKLVRLLGVDGSVIASFDATAFVKDGMIESVELVHENEKGESGEFIKIVWNTDEGSDVVYLDVTELVDIYEAGDGISVTDSSSSTSTHTISVKLADGSESFLTVTSDGVKLSGVQEAIDAAVAEAAAAATTAVKEADGNEHVHVSVDETVSSDGHTTYVISEEDIASKEFVGSLNDAADAGTVCGAIAKNAADITTNTEAISALETVVETLEAETVTVKTEDEEKHIVVTSNTDENGATTYTLSSSDVASAALVGEFSDTSYEGTVCAAVEGIANSLMWVEVE